MNIKEYNEIAEELKPKKHVIKNTCFAFLFGGLIGLFGEILLEGYKSMLNVSGKQAGIMMIITIIFIASLLTGIGVFDRIGSIAGAGLFIPITGFSNAMTSCALDGKTEGLVTGIGANIFKLAGAVISFGIVASFLLGGIRYVFTLIGS